MTTNKVDPKSLLIQEMLEPLRDPGLVVELPKLLAALGLPGVDVYTERALVKLSFMEATGATHFGGMVPLLHWITSKMTGRRKNVPRRKGLIDKVDNVPDPMTPAQARDWLRLYVEALWYERVMKPNAVTR